MNIAYDGEMPERATEGAAGYDLRAAEDVWIPPTGWATIRCGLRLAISEGYCGMICPRSGLAAKHGITVLNAPGIIDSDYRGEIKVVLANLGGEGKMVRTGDRIAQLVLVPYADRVLWARARLTETERGDGGFGSTGDV